jgi:hypothetical protein
MVMPLIFIPTLTNNEDKKEIPGRNYTRSYPT